MSRTQFAYRNFYANYSKIENGDICIPMSLKSKMYNCNMQSIASGLDCKSGSNVASEQLSEPHFRSISFVAYFHVRSLSKSYATWYTQTYLTACQNIVIPPVPAIANFSPKYFILSKVYIDEGGVK